MLLTPTAASIALNEMVSKVSAWPTRSPAKHFLAHNSIARSHPGGKHQGSNQLPMVTATPQQQVLDQAKQVLLEKRKNDPYFASVPWLGHTESVEGLKHKLFADATRDNINPKALQVVRQLLPDLAGRLQNLRPEILLSLTADTSAVASRLLQLKMWFPRANVSIMVAQRPTLVLDEEFNGIPAAIIVLQHWFEADAIDHMVQEQPLFLVEDVESAISSLNRWMSTTNGAHKLQRNPQLLLSLVPTRKLSLW